MQYINTLTCDGHGSDAKPVLAVLACRTWFVQMRYPPYTSTKLTMMQLLT